MANRQATYHTGDEPIDGYRLMDFLGAGQFGEVWKAADLQTGRQVAIKFIDLTHSPSALKEVKAFNLVKQLNHPNLVPIVTARLQDRNNRPVSFDDAQDTARMKLRQVHLKDLIIVMGLGEKSLAARLKEFNPDGTPPDRMRGLPGEELLEYMDGAARGIDYLNKPVHNLPAGVPDGPIVHCDIKPDNMMIVSGQVQIADCGVAVVVTADVRKTQAAGSPAYSPVELTLNRPGPTTDQYSLAISYYELRTGKLPFPDDISAMEVMIRHQRGELDFADGQLSDGERKVLRYATAPKADQRYPSCTDFVKQLRRASDGLKPLSAAEVSRPKMPSDASIPRPPSGPQGPFSERPGGSVVDFSDIPPTDHGEPERPPVYGVNTAASVGQFDVDDRPVGESGIVGPGRPRSRPVVGLQATAMPTDAERGALTSTPGVGGTLPVLPGTVTQAAGLKKWLAVGAGAGVLTLGLAGGVMYLVNRPSVAFDSGAYTEVVSSRLASLTPAAFEKAFQFIAEKEVLPHPEAPGWAAKERDGLAKAADQVAGNPNNWPGPGSFVALRTFLDELDGRYGLKPAAAELRQKHLKPAAGRRLAELLKPADPKGFADAQQFVGELTGLEYAAEWAKGYKGELAKTAPKVRDGLVRVPPVADVTNDRATTLGEGFEQARQFVERNAEFFPEGKAKAVAPVEAAGTKLMTALIEAGKLDQANLFLFVASGSEWKTKERSRLNAAVVKANKPFVQATADATLANSLKDASSKDASAASLSQVRQYIAELPSAPDDWRTAATKKVNEAGRSRLQAILQPLAAAAPGTTPAVAVLKAARKYVADQQTAKPFDPPADEVTWANDELGKAARTVLRNALPAVNVPFADARGRLDAVAVLVAAMAGPDIGIDLGTQAKKDIEDRAGEILKAGLAKPPAVALPDAGPAQAFVRDAYRLAELRGGMATDVDNTRWALLGDVLKLPGEKPKVLTAAAAFATGSGPSLPDKARQMIGDAASDVLDGILNADPKTSDDAVAQVAAGRKFLTGPDAPPDWKAAVPDAWLKTATAKVDAAPKARVDKYTALKTPAGFNDAWAFLSKLPDSEKVVATERPKVQAAALDALKAKLEGVKDPAADGLAFVAEMRAAPEEFKTAAAKQIAGPATDFAKTKVGDGSPANVADLRGYVQKHQPALGKEWADPLLVVANVGEADWTVGEKLKGETADAVKAATDYIKSRKGLPVNWVPDATVRVKKVQDGRDAVIKPVETLLGKDTLNDLNEAERLAERTLVGAKFAADLAGVKRRLPGLREDVQDKELRAAVKRLADDKQPTADKLAAALAEFREPERQRKFAARVVGMAGLPEQAGWQPIAAAELRSRRLLDPLEPDARKRTAEWHYKHLARTVGEPARAGLKGLAGGGSAADAKAALDKLSAELAAAEKEPAWKDAPADPELKTLAGLGQAWQDAMAGQAGLQPLKELLLKGSAGEFAPALRKQYVTASKTHVSDPAARVPDLRELRDALSGSDRLTFDADFQPVLTAAVKELVRLKVPAANELKGLVGDDAKANEWAAVALAEVDPSAPLPAAVPSELSAYKQYVSAVRATDPATAADALATVYANRDTVPDVLKADGRKKTAGERIAAACEGKLTASLVGGPKVTASDDKVPGWLKTAAALADDDKVRVRASAVDGGDPALASAVKASPEEVAKWTALSVGERAVYCIRLADARPAGDERTQALAAAAGVLIRWYDAERIALDRKFLDEPPADAERLKTVVFPAYKQLRETVWAAIQERRGTETDGTTLAHHRLTMAVGRLVSERPVDYKDFLAGTWAAADASVRRHAEAARPDEYGTAALLGMNRLFVMYDKKEGTAADQAAVWARVFELADKALQTDSDIYAANFAVGTLLHRLHLRSDRYKPLSDAATNAAGGAAVKRMTPSDPTALLSAVEGYFRKSAENPPQEWSPSLHFDHAQVLFLYTTERVRYNRLDKDQIHDAMSAVVARGQKAINLRVLAQKPMVYKVMGIAGEDAAWQGGRPDAFATALAHLRAAQTEAEKAEAEAADANNRADARFTRYLVEVDRARCLYRAGLFGSDAERTAEAVKLATALAAPDDLETLLAYPKEKGRGPAAVAEARYWKANALWAAGKLGEAAEAFRSVAAVPKADSEAWAWKAVYDGGRLAAARRADGAAADLRKAAAELTAGEHFKYDDVLLALADVLEDKPQAAAQRLEPMARTLLELTNTQNEKYGDLRATEPFQHGMLILAGLWAKQVYGPLDEEYRKKLDTAFTDARKKYPWLLPSKDQPPGVKSISYQ